MASLPEPGNSRPWWIRRRVRLGLWAVGLVVLYAVTAGIIAPWAARGYAERRLSAVTGTAVRIADLDFHPFTLVGRVTGLSVDDLTGRELLRWKVVEANIDGSSVWRRELRVSDLRVEDFNLHLRRDSNGVINAIALQQQLAARAASTSATPSANAPSNSLPAIHLERFHFTNGLVALEDEVPAERFAFELTPITFSIGNLTTRPGSNAVLALEARGDAGERFWWGGHFSLQPPAFRGEIRGENLPLARPAVYTDRLSPLRPTNGTAHFRVPYEVALRGTSLVARIAGASAGVSRLAVIEHATGTPFASVERLELGGLEASLGDRSLALGSLRLEGGELHIRREPGATGEPSTTNLRQLLDPAVVEEIVRDLTDWRLAIGEFEAVEGTVTLRDQVLNPPEELGVQGARLLVRGLTNASNAPPARVEGAAQWGRGGEFRIAAGGTLLPARATGQVEVIQFPVASIARYVSEVLRLNITRGIANARVTAEYGQAGPEAPLLRCGGEASVQDFVAVESVSGTDFLRWNQVAARGLQFQLEPHRIDLAEIAISKLQTSLVLMTNGQLNVLQLLQETRELARDSAGAPAPAVAAPVTPPATDASPAAAADEPFWATWPMRVGRVTLEEVGIFAADDFIGGGFKTSVESLDGEVRNLALPTQEPAEIDLQGRLSAVSGFTLAGTLLPDPKQFAADLKLSTRRADLVQFAPYSIRFAGYPVTRGELTAEVHYRVHGDTLEADNRLLVDQFTLGAKQPSPDAVNLPLKLGVALLKDREGRINLDVPLSGSLSDPEFRVMPLLWQVLRNLVVKAATAPFKLLGSLFGSGDEDLEFLEFATGLAEIGPAQTNRLVTLARALTERPQLELQIVPGFDPQGDRRALALAKLDERLRALRQEELAATRIPPANPATPGVEVAAEDRPRLLALAYQRDFGALPTNAPPTPAAAPTDAPSGTTERVVLAADPAAAGTPASPAVAAAASSLEERLLQLLEVKPEELRALGTRRAEAARAGLVTQTPELEGRITIATDAEETQLGKARIAFRLQ